MPSQLSPRTAPSPRETRSLAAAGGRASSLASYTAVPSPLRDNLKIETEQDPSSSTKLVPRRDRSKSGQLAAEEQKWSELSVVQWSKDRISNLTWSDLVMFIAGFLVSALLLLCITAATRHHGGGAGSSFEPQPDQFGVQPKQAPPEALQLRHNLSAAKGRSPAFASVQKTRYAFVQIAHDEPGTDCEHLWRALAVARMLQRLSRHPLVLLTNATSFPDGTPLAQSLWKLNVEVVPVYEVPLPSGVVFKSPKLAYAYWKLQIWRLVQYEKLIWLDTDSAVYRNVDWLFERRPMWAAANAPMCGINATSMSSGILLIEPSEDTYRSLLKYADTMPRRWWERGDKQLISDYFEFVVGKPVKLLRGSDAAFGSCLGSIPGIPYEEGGLWNIPAFVHRSSAKDECFYFDTTKQLVDVSGTVMNVCHYHPLGHYWRDHFCDALSLVGTSTVEAAAFCDDDSWNAGGSSPSWGVDMVVSHFAAS